jgi:protein associated with RNAse G/E
MKLSKGMHVAIHSYKHNKRLHRIWKKTVVLEENQHVLVTGHHRTRVIEHDGRSWHTKEPAICYFYNDLWFNIIGMLKKDGVYFYCNLSSPYLYDGEAIKYIDYDLDVKVFPDGSYIVLDEKEYDMHSDKMCYPDDIQEIIQNQIDILVERIKAKEKPFDLSDIHVYYDVYKNMNKR